MNKSEANGWRLHLKFDRDGKGYLDLAGAALFLEMEKKTLSNHLYDETGPKAYKKNGRLRFYLDDLRTFEKGVSAIAHDTNWYKVRRSA